MGRKASIGEEELMGRLSDVFRDVGYEGATLSLLSEKSGLKRASLYHRFPGGKEQMANEVLAKAEAWLTENILIPLQQDGTPEARVRHVADRLDAFYSGGKQACLLNMLTSARIQSGPFVGPIRKLFNALIAALRDVAVEAGQTPETAFERAERVVILLHGSLVLSRGTGSTEPFKRFVKTLPEELLG